MSARRLLFGFLMLNLLLSAACIHQAYDGGQPDAQTPGAQSASVFDYERAPIEVTTGAVEAFDGFESTAIRFGSYLAPGDPDRDVICHYYRNDAGGRRPGIVVLPILGGDYAPSRAVAEFLAQNGFSVLRFERKAGFLDPDSDMDTQAVVLRESVIDIRRGLDWWLEQPGVDADRIGVVGISMGGIGASLLLSCEPRIQAGVLLITGGKLAHKMAYLKEIEIVQFRDAVMRREGIDRETFHERAEEALAPVEPLNHAHRIDPSRVLMVTAVFDMVVSFDSAHALYRAAGRPDRFLIPTGHYTAALYLGLVEIESVKHFETVFGRDRVAVR